MIQKQGQFLQRPQSNFFFKLLNLEEKLRKTRFFLKCNLFNELKFSNPKKVFILFSPYNFIFKSQFLEKYQRKSSYL